METPELPQEPAITEKSERKKLIQLRDNSNRAKAVMIIFAVLILGKFVIIADAINILAVLDNRSRGVTISYEQGERMDEYSIAINLAWLVLYIISIIAFLNWFRRAYGNLHRIDSTVPDYQETAAVYSWIIPIVNLYRPYQIMKEIWNKTQNFIESYDSFYYRQKGGFFIGMWVFLFVSSAIAGRIYMELDGISTADLILSTQVGLAIDIETVLEASLVIYIVYMISNMESRLAEEVIKDRGMVIP